MLFGKLELALLVSKLEFGNKLIIIFQEFTYSVHKDFYRNQCVDKFYAESYQNIILRIDSYSQ
jgi:hypothetical protein